MQSHAVTRGLYNSRAKPTPACARQCRVLGASARPGADAPVTRPSPPARIAPKHRAPPTARQHALCLDDALLRRQRPHLYVGNAERSVATVAPAGQALLSGTGDRRADNRGAVAADPVDTQLRPMGMDRVGAGDRPHKPADDRRPVVEAAAD